MCVSMGGIRAKEEIGVIFVDKGDCFCNNEIKAEIRCHPASYHKVKVR